MLSRPWAAWISFWETRTGKRPPPLRLQRKDNDFFARTGSYLREVPRQVSGRPEALRDDPDAAVRAGRTGLRNRRTGGGSGEACGLDAAAGGGSGRLLLHAPQGQGDGQVSRPGLHQYFLSAGRRRGVVRTGLRQTASRPQAGEPEWLRFAGRSGMHRSLLLGARGTD